MIAKPRYLFLPQVVWAAHFGFVTSHEADILWERHVGHLLLQQTEGWSNLQSILPGHSKNRFECSHKHTELHTVLSTFCKVCVICLYESDFFFLIHTCKTLYFGHLTLSVLPSPPAGCGGSISSWNGSISSPYYPSYYPPNIDCTWTLRVSHASLCV